MKTEQARDEPRSAILGGRFVKEARMAKRHVGQGGPAGARLAPPVSSVALLNQ
jgi:hypothetical protein